VLTDGGDGNDAGDGPEGEENAMAHAVSPEIDK
jgi:hypothetical protein